MKQVNDILLLQACAAPSQLLALRQHVASPEVSLAVGGGTPKLHDPTLQLLFRDFCEALVRIAHLKYRHLPTLQQRLHQLVHSHILPHALQVSTSCRGLMMPLSRPSPRNCKKMQFL